MKISFCISCKNRFHQISKTLAQNLQDNFSSHDSVEFILVDFDSRDGLKKWVTQNFKNELNTGYLKFYYTDKMKDWHCCIAKNTAHLLATGDIIVNLDCDNYTGEDGGEFVKEQFIRYGDDLLLHQSSGSPSDGNFGRISMQKKYFHLIGGYNELFNPMSYQDTDLMLRLIRLGLIYTPKCDNRYNKAIYNTKDEGILYTGSGKTYLNMSLENKAISDANLNADKIVVNNNIWGIRNNIYRYLDDEFLQVTVQ